MDIFYLFSRLIIDPITGRLERAGYRWLVLILEGLLFILFSFVVYFFLCLGFGLSGQGSQALTIVISAVPAVAGLFFIYKGIGLKVVLNRAAEDQQISANREEARLLERSFYDPKIKQQFIDKKRAGLINYPNNLPKGGIGEKKKYDRIITVIGTTTSALYLSLIMFVVIIRKIYPYKDSLLSASEGIVRYLILISCPVVFFFSLVGFIVIWWAKFHLLTKIFLAMLNLVVCGITGAIIFCRVFGIVVTIK